MPLSFEVKETDLLGRVGALKVGGKVLETPCLLPVIHPVSQAVSTRELREMGFRGLMTNSYIIGGRRREEALRRGIHDLLGFDGVFMTDSGGYQVLEYGDLGVGFRDVASLQSGIGSDLAVTLDRPTGYPQSRGAAEESVDYSLENAKATLKEFGGAATSWVGPIQGGLHLDLVARSASSLARAGFEILALGSPVQVMENYMFSDLVRMIVAARGVIPYSMPLHLFGAGHPLTTALSVALGCDTFDSASYILFARGGRYMTHGGVLTLESMKYLPCSCEVCAKTTAGELQDLDQKERTRRLAVHNLLMLREEVEACKEAIVEGRLWDLVEEKSMTHPRLREAFVELSKHSELLADGTPLLKGRGLMLRSPEDLRRPELVAAGKRLSRVMKRAPAREARLTAWDAVPVGLGGRGGLDGTRLDTYRVHPALGVYPAELDFVYPFTQSVIAAGLGSGDGLKEAKARLRRLGYRSVRPEPSKRGTRRVRSRRTRRGASPSPRLSSARPR